MAPSATGIAPPRPGRPRAAPLRPERTEIALRGERLALHAVRAGPPEQGGDAAGAPLILLHGMASSWRQWRRTLLRLGDSLPLAALDFPGFGDSDRPRRPMRAGDYADACEEWCRAHAWPALAAVGHSFGGAVLVDWASRYPQRFESLGLLAPAAVFHPWHSAGGGAIRWPLVGSLVVPLFIWLASTRTLGPRYFSHIVVDLGALDPDEITDLQWGCRHAREMLRALDYYRFPGLEEALAHIAVPVTIGWGTHDRVVPHADAAVFTAHLPRAELRTWQACGHVPMMERPSACDDLLRAVWKSAARAEAAGR